MTSKRTIFYQVHNKLKISKYRIIHSIVDVELKFTRYYSDENNPGKSAWTTVSMIEAGIE